MIHNEAKFHEIIDTICETIDIKKKDLLSPNRDRALVDARRIAINLLVREESYTVSSAARGLNRHHATGIHYKKTHDLFYETDLRYKSTYDLCVIKYKKEEYSSFKDVLDLTKQYKDSQYEVLKLEKEVAELKYSILKLENKFRLHNFMIPA
jgi:hypothetical protein